MDSSYDFVANCRPGQTLRTRGWSEAIIERIAAAEGLIYGEVRMYGPCVWRRDGLYRDSPAGAAGPLDLLPPTQGEAAPRNTASVKEALDPANRTFCCD